MSDTLNGMTTLSKACSTCGDEKLLEDFHRRSATKDGRQHSCKVCVKTYNDKWRAAHAEDNREYQREWQRSERSVVRNQAAHFLRKYGLTMEQREEMIAEQEGKCYLCQEVPDWVGKRGGLHVDHNEETKVVRKMLCGSCNRGIGLLHHDPALLRRAADYLEAFE